MVDEDEYDFAPLSDERINQIIGYGPFGSEIGMYEMAREVREHRDAASLVSHPGFLQMKPLSREQIDAYIEVLRGSSMMKYGAMVHPADDGMALQAVSHPAGPFWLRLWHRLFPPQISASSLEAVDLDLGDGGGLTYVKFPLPPATNRIEEEIRRRLNDGDGA